MKKLTIAVAIVMLFVLNDNKAESIVIPNEAIRVRVIANSNSSNDIEVKEKLSKEIQPVIYNLLKDVSTIEDAREIITKTLPDIDIEIEKVLKQEKYDISHKTNYGLNYFPKKVFKGVTYEEGFYESLVITLGEGNGDNWWCVLFPPLCMLEFDEENTDIDYQTFIGEILNKYIK